MNEGDDINYERYLILILFDNNFDIKLTSWKYSKFSISNHKTSLINHLNVNLGFIGSMKINS